MTTDNPSEHSTERLRQWHRLFGIALMEVFEGAPWRVELEQELALRSQLLDVAIIEATGEATERGPVAELRSAQNPAQSPGRPLELPDGLENLRPHNLLTYKSRYEALNAWEFFASEQDRIRQGLIHSRDSMPPQSKPGSQESGGITDRGATGSSHSTFPG